MINQKYIKLNKLQFVIETIDDELNKERNVFDISNLHNVIFIPHDEDTGNFFLLRDEKGKILITTFISCENTPNFILFLSENFTKSDLISFYEQSMISATDYYYEEHIKYDDEFTPHYFNDLLPRFHKEIMKGIEML